MKRNLYHIQDQDRPMYVVAKDWQEALNKWKRVVGAEIGIPPDDETMEPDGIALFATHKELICDTIDAANTVRAAAEV